MNDSENKKEQPDKEPRCDPKQLELLKKCSEKKDMTDWNNWREENPKEEIWLQGVNLRHAHLKKADLSFAHLEGADLFSAHLEKAKLFLAHLEGAQLGGANLEGANLYCAHLQRVNFINAHLEGANLEGAHLKGAKLDGAHLEGADLRAHLEEACLNKAHLEGAHLDWAFLKRARLFSANLKGAHLNWAHLEGAYLHQAYLEGTRFKDVHLEGADFSAGSVDGSTLFWKCSVDRETDFRGVGLNSCRIDEGTRYLLEYNKRRLNWEDWYKGESWPMMRQLLTCPVRLFWCLSDYGRSTIRILLVFLALAIFFAVAYWAKPDCVMVNGQVGGLVNFLHALYFSVVTMTTLGFGDIAANPQSPCGQVLLMLQVFCGYFLLGAIVTRLSILFTAGGPAGRFSKNTE